jgi:fatty-acyl-CoA synthase
VFWAAGERWTYDQLRRRADRLAAGLLGLGLYKGDRIGIWAPNRPEWLITQFATARIGLILVNINPAYRRHELEYALNKVGAKALITARQFKSSDYLGMLRDLAPELDGATPGRLRAKRLPELSSVIQLGQRRIAGTWTFAEVMGRGGGANRARLDAISRSLRPTTPSTSSSPPAPRARPRGRRSPTATSSTTAASAPPPWISGPTTGSPSRCRSITASAWCWATSPRSRPAPRWCSPAKPSTRWRPLQALAGERCTAVHGVPTMFAAMIDHPRFAEFDLKTLRTGIMAGSPCPIELMKRVVSQMHAREITIAYGMTETSPVSFQSDTHDSLERRVATVGRIHPHVEVKIVDRRGPHRAGG